MKKTAHVRYYTHPGSLSGLEEFARSRQKPLEPMLTRFGLTLDTLWILGVSIYLWRKPELAIP